MKKSKFLAKIMVGVMIITSLGTANVSAISEASTAERSNVITEFGNMAEIAGLTYCDTEGYNSTSSVRYTRTAEENTADTNLVMPENLGLVTGKKYSYSFYIKPVQMNSRLWIRMNGTTNGGAGSIALGDGVLAVKSGPSCTKIEDAGNGWYKVYSPSANEHKIAWKGMAFLLATSGNPVDFYIDNFSITDESGNEIIANGGFELPTQDDEENEIVRENNVIAEFGNTAEIGGLTYSDTVGYNSTSSVRYTKTADENTADTNLAMPENLGLVVGQKYSYSFYFKPVTFTTKLWIRMNGTTNGGAGAIGMSNDVLSATNGASCITVEDAGNGWYKVSSPTANEHKIGWNGMPFFLATGGAAVDFYIDNFSILDENGNEIITNGGFELPTQDDEEDEVLRDNNVITEFGNTTELAGLTYSDSVGYNSTSSVHYKKTAAENTSDTSLAMHPNLGMVEGNKYSFSFYIKPVAMTSMWIRINGNTNEGAGSIGLNSNGVFSVINGGSFMSVTSAGNGWYKVSSNTANEHKIKWSGMALLYVTGGGAVDFYLDDFSITDENGNELVVNGGFEYQEPEDEPEEEPIITREDNIVTEFGNTAEIAGLTYCDTVGYNSTSSVHYKKTADENTADTALVMHQNLGMIEGNKYSISFYIKPVAMTSLWIRINGTTNGGAGSIGLNANGVLYTGNAASFMTVTSVGDGWYKVASNSANEHKIAWSGMALLFATSGGAVDFYLDDFSIKNESGTEIIANGGFELPVSQVSNFEMVDNGDGTRTVSVSVANRAAGNDYTAVLILATHDGSVMQVIEFNDEKTVAQGKIEILSETIAVNDGENLTAFVWDSVDGMTPLTFARQLISAE